MIVRVPARHPAASATLTTRTDHRTVPAEYLQAPADVSVEAHHAGLTVTVGFIEAKEIVWCRGNDVPVADERPGTLPMSDR